MHTNVIGFWIHTLSIAEHSVTQSFILWKVVSIIKVKIVAKEPNLKEIERRTYMSYHQDGLLDIFAGLYVLGFGLGLFVDLILDFGMGMILMPGVFVALALPLWIAAKRRITMPRIGFVNFGIRGANKLTALFIGTMVAGFGFLFAFTLATFQAGSRQWLNLLFQNGLLIIGFGSFAVCILFGYSMGLKRLNAYGIGALIALVIGHFTGIFAAYIFMALAIAVIVTGFALLIGFVKKYPLKGDKAIAE